MGPMADSYRIFGAAMAPCSTKVRSYFRYKGVPHQWNLRNGDSHAEFEPLARLPIIARVAADLDQPGCLGGLPT